MPYTPKDSAEKARAANFGIKVLNLRDTDRSKLLHARYSFFVCTQHAHYKANWAGGQINLGTAYLNERLSPQGFVPTNAAPTVYGYADRKPDTPHHLGYQIVKRFTDLLLSQISRPSISVPSDAKTEAYLDAVMEASHSWATLQSARDIKGAVGSAAIKVGVEEGYPTSEPLQTQHLWVRKWAKRPGWIPEEVIEQKIIRKMEKNDDGDLESVEYWQTRAWDNEFEYEYEDVPTDYNDDDDELEIPILNAIPHNAGRCPIVWLQNTRNTESPEGQEDNFGTYELSDGLDRIRSFIKRGTIANIDPTLIYSDHDRNRKKNPMVRKGHGQRIDISVEGEVKLLESSGSGVEMGLKTATELRHDILQIACCVIMDPETLSAYKSGEAISQLWKSMEKRAETLRIPLADEIRQICNMWINIGIKYGVTSIEAESDDEKIELPPREITENGKTRMEIHEIGKGRWIKLDWGPFHRPTMTEFQTLVGGLTTANGAKPVLSAETSTEIAVNIMGLGSAEQEKERIAGEKEEGMKEMAEAMKGSGSMFPGVDPKGDKEVAKEKDSIAKKSDESAMKKATEEQKSSKETKETE